MAGPIPDTSPDVDFDGGPLDGVRLTGLFAGAILDAAPPFACFEVDGRFEHYVRLDTSESDCGKMCFTYAGSCMDITSHPDCGHHHG